MTDTPDVFPTTSFLTLANYWDHFLARWRFQRSEHKVRPGLYALGKPTPDSPVLISANYTLSFDALRTTLKGLDVYILVLNTFGINVWCAAGKGTFGTEELVERLETSELAKVVRHRRVIVPQLGAPGVAAHEVKKQSGFTVEYGPVRAKDLPAYLKTHQTTLDMRQVHFTLADRLTLVPVELMGVLLPTLLVAVVIYFRGGLSSSFMVIGGVLTGVALFPVLYPWLPTKDFSTKGFILGGLYALAVILLLVLPSATAPLVKAASALSHLLIWPALVGYVALNFTGSTPYPSRSGVRHEIYRYVRPMAVMFVLGIILNIAAGFMG
jgi:uncharacterized membrane protein